MRQLNRHRRRTNDQQAARRAAQLEGGAWCEPIDRLNARNRWLGHMRPCCDQDMPRRYFMVANRHGVLVA